MNFREPYPMLWAFIVNPNSIKIRWRLHARLTASLRPVVVSELDVSLFPAEETEVLVGSIALFFHVMCIVNLIAKGRISEPFEQ